MIDKMKKALFVLIFCLVGIGNVFAQFGGGNYSEEEILNITELSTSYPIFGGWDLRILVNEILDINRRNPVHSIDDPARFFPVYVPSVLDGVASYMQRHNTPYVIGLDLRNDGVAHIYRMENGTLTCNTVLLRRRN